MGMLVFIYLIIEGHLVLFKKFKKIQVVSNSIYFGSLVHSEEYRIILRVIMSVTLEVDKLSNILNLY